MSAFAVSKRNDWMDFISIIADILAPLYAFLFLAKPEARPVPQPATPPAPQPIPAGWRTLDDLPASAEFPQSEPATAAGPSDDDTQEIIVQPMPGPLPVGADDYDDDRRRAEAVTFDETEDEGDERRRREWDAQEVADEPVLCGPLFVRVGEGKATRYVPFDSADGQPAGVLYRRRKVGKRWVYQSAAMRRADG